MLQNSQWKKPHDQEAQVRYSPVTTSQTHALPRISTRGYTQKAAVCHA